MEKYVGIKEVLAEPCTLAFYNQFSENKVTPADVIPPYSGEGYKIQYEDGYVSWSPKEVFDKFYRPVSKNFSFSKAIEFLKSGYKLRREGWNGKGIFIELQRPDENSKMTHPYIYIDTTGLQTDNQAAPKSLVPWLASQTDMLSEDWQLLEDISCVQTAPCN